MLIGTVRISHCVCSFAILTLFSPSARRSACSISFSWKPSSLCGHHINGSCQRSLLFIATPFSFAARSIVFSKSLTNGTRNRKIRRRVGICRSLGALVRAMDRLHSFNLRPPGLDHWAPLQLIRASCQNSSKLTLYYQMASIVHFLFYTCLELEAGEFATISLPLEGKILHQALERSR